MRYRIALALFRLAARIYPLSGRGCGQSHYVGNRWLQWNLEWADQHLASFKESE